MSAEFSMNYLSTFCATVVIAFTSLPWARLLFSALKVRKEGNLHAFNTARATQFSAVGQHRDSWLRRSYR
jgi:hypothetical protein